MHKPKPAGIGAIGATSGLFVEKSWLLALTLILITFAAYTPVWRAGFIWDDKKLLIENRMVKASDGLYRFWFTTEAPDYYPLTWSLWWLESWAWGANAIGYHAVNLLLHTVNVVLLWLVLRRLQIPGAWLAGLVFAVHPVNVATVGWVSEQKTTLSMFFYLVAILLYLRFGQENQWRWYGLSLVAFLLALLSKTAVVMLPIVLLGCVWWRRGGIRGKDVMRSLPFFAFSLILGLVTVWFQYHRALGGITIRTDSFLSRLVTAGWLPWFYLCKALIPVNLTAIYPQWHIDASRWISYIPGMALVGCFALFWCKRETWGRPLLFALGYFVATLFPVLGFFDQGFYRYSLVADHWQYYAIVGVIALPVAAGMTVCRQFGKQGRDVGVSVGAVVIMALGMATWTRASIYRDDETLWRDNVAKNPNAWVAQNNLGNVLVRGKHEETIGHFEQALKFKPDFTEAHYNLRGASVAAGKVQEAIGHFEQALRLKPEYANAHYNLGLALAQTGRMQDAIQHFEQALRINPTDADAHANLANAFFLTGRTQDSILQFEQALRINPDLAEAHNNLGAALLQSGRVQEAIGQYQQALQIKPNFVQAHNNLGGALLRVGRVQDAIGHFEEALQLKPDYVEAQRNLARARTMQ